MGPNQNATQNSDQDADLSEAESKKLADLLMSGVDEGLEEAARDLEQLRKIAGDDYKPLQELFAENVRIYFAKEGYSDSQIAVISMMLQTYLQVLLDVHLQDALPDRLFENLDYLLLTNVIEPQHVPGLVGMVYEQETGENLLSYSMSLFEKLAPKIKEIVSDQKEYFAKVQKMSPAAQAQLASYIDKEDHEAVEEMLSSIKL